MKRVDFRRVFVVAGLASLMIVYAVLWTRIITTPAERTGADFISFYAAGRIAQNEGAAHVYDLELIHKYEEGVVGFSIDPVQISPYIHPPFIILLAQMISLDNYIISFILWNLIMLAFLALGTIPLGYLLRGSFTHQQLLIALAGILLFYPAFISLGNGQDSAILYLAVSLWMLGILSGRDMLAGLGLALTTVRPQVTLVLALPFLFRRQRVWWWFVAGAVGLVLLSIAVAGVEGVQNFLQSLLIYGRETDYHISEAAMVNLIGLLRRIFPLVQPQVLQVAGWGVYLAAIFFLCVLWARNRDIAEKHIGLAAMLAVFTAPHLHYHDLILLLVPILALMVVLVRGGFISSLNASLFPLAVSLILLFGTLVPVLHYNLPIFIMALIILLLWIPEKIIRKPVLPG